MSSSIYNMTPSEDTSGFTLVSRPPRQWKSNDAHSRSSDDGWKRHTKRMSPLYPRPPTESELHPPPPPNALRVVANEALSARANQKHQTPFTSPALLLQTDKTWSSFMHSSVRKDPQVVPPPRLDKAPKPPMLSHTVDQRTNNHSTFLSATGTLSSSETCSLSHRSLTSATAPSTMTNRTTTLQSSQYVDMSSAESRQGLVARILTENTQLVASKVVEPLEQLVIAERLAKLRAATRPTLEAQPTMNTLVELLAALELMLTSAVTSAALLGKQEPDVESRAALANLALVTLKQALYFEKDTLATIGDTIADAEIRAVYETHFSELTTAEAGSLGRFLQTFTSALREERFVHEQTRMELKNTQEKNKCLERLLAQHRSALSTFASARHGGASPGSDNGQQQDDNELASQQHLLLFKAATFDGPTTAITLDASAIRPTTAPDMNNNSNTKRPTTMTPSFLIQPATDITTSLQPAPRLFIPHSNDEWSTDMSMMSNVTPTNVTHTATGKFVTNHSEALGGRKASLVPLGDHQGQTIDFVLAENKQLHKRCRVQAEQLDVLRAQISQQERQLQMLEKAVTDVTMENYELSLQFKALVTSSSASPVYSPMLQDGRSAEMLATQSNLEIAKLLGLSSAAVAELGLKAANTPQSIGRQRDEQPHRRRRSSTQKES